MAGILRALRPIRNELKKLLKEQPVLISEFAMPKDREEYIKIVKLFIRTLKTTRDSMKELHDKLLTIEGITADEKKAVEELAETDSLFLLEVSKCIELYINHLESFTSVQNQDPSSNVLGNQRGGSTPLQTVKLPKLEMKKFYGDITQWNEFWDSYKAAVHQNNTISAVAKFTYLRTVLGGEAISAVSGLSLTADNYNQAIDILRKRYGNQQLVINSHYTALSNLHQASENTASIRTLVDDMEKHLHSLEAMNEDVNHNHFISVILSKLPKYFIMRLEESRGENLWTVATLRARIQQLLAAREVAEQHQRSASNLSKTDQQKKSNSHHNTTSSLVAISEEKKRIGKCVFCNGKHWSDECRNYSTIEARKRQITGRCFVCLQKGHTHKDCKTERPCAHCNQTKNHHRSLCPKKFLQSPMNKFQNSSKFSDHKTKPQKGENACTVSESQLKFEASADEVNAENAFINTDDRGLLQTACSWVAPANVKSNTNVQVFIVLDSGSQRTYITNELAQKLGTIPHTKETLLVYPFGVTEPKRIETNVVKLEMKLLDGSKFQFTAHTVAKIGEVHHAPINVSKFGPLFKTMPLADSNRKNDTENCTIDILIGNNYYWDLVTSEKVELTKGLYMIGTKLGWTVSGRLNEKTTWKLKPSAVLMTQVTNMPINQNPYIEADPPLLMDANFQDWWHLETIGIHDCPQDPSDEQALMKFNETIQYENQRYFVSWPWKDNVELLPTNYSLALGRLNALIRKLKVDPDLLEKYDEIIHIQEERGIIEKLPGKENLNIRKHYLPHHPVITPDKETTKVRIVYDGSAKIHSNNLSINECMHRGPVILDNVCALLIRFRFYQSALIADIEKAFLQVGLQPADRDVTRFLWMKDPRRLTLENNLQIYRFTRVPFGIISSPFLLGATISHHLLKDGSPTAQRILRNIYVDNVITGASSSEQAIKFYNEAKLLLQSASMNLRDWLSNDQKVMATIPEEDQLKKTSTNVLGLKWNTKDDTIALAHAIKPVTSTTVITKRNILKLIAGIFDPLGLWCPTVVKAKAFLQTLWSENKEWDAPVGEENQLVWKEITNDLLQIDLLVIPRFIRTDLTTDQAKYEIHCFTDASKRAYGTCVYLRVHEGLNVSIHLMHAKVRLTPLRKITIPRLELLAATVGSRLMKFVENSLDVTVASRYLWTDSQCVLHWIQSTKPLSTFVSNRIKDLKLMKNVEFRYVSTDQNPADLTSRGTTVKELQDSNLWWNGPTWLTKDSSTWPNASYRLCIDAETLEKISSEEKKSVIFGASLLTGDIDALTPFDIDYTKFSSLIKLLRVTAWCFRFCDQLRTKIKSNHQNKLNRLSPALDANELKIAKLLWLKYVQKKHFGEVLDAIHKGKRIPIKEQLGLWLDDNGILRCKGRLTNANLEHNATYPILLPKKDWFTTLVIKDYHIKLLHSGVAHTLSQIRCEFWIPSGRSEVFHVMKSCQNCKRINGGPYQPPTMPALPKERVTESPPFTHTGLDYLGPLYVKNHGTEKKVWICLFTCMVTRAVHLELVEDLTAEQFLLCLRRFIARRGKPSFIISDNAKQFKLTKLALDHLWKTVVQDEAITSYVSQMGIKWTFIPERAPWMGGFYERLVQSVKRALRKSIQNVCLTTVQLETVIIEIEAILNSRPLTYVGSDFKDGRALTPAHFLTLNSKAGMPSVEVEDPTDPQYMDRISSKETLLRSWTKGERHLQAFWTVWKHEYLLNIRERTQSRLKHPKAAIKQRPAVGDIVHIRNESPRGSWPLARIIQVIPSADSEIRSAKVQLPSGTIIKRPIVHLYPMELVEDQSHNASQLSDNSIDQQANLATMQQQRQPERTAAKIAKEKIKALAEESSTDDPELNSAHSQTLFSLFNPSILLMIICLLAILIQSSAALQPLLCEKGNAKITLNLTDSTNCKLHLTNNDREKVYNARIAIYKRNVAKYDSPAYKCSKVKTIVEAYTNFAKAGWEQRQRDEPVEISESECWFMINNRRCREGPLLGGETAAFTENKVDPPYTSGNAWDCCRWYSKETTNCFLVKGKVYQSYHGHMESNLANVANCQYERESCTLYDQSILVWKVNKTATCEYVLWQTTEGKLWNNQFLSEDYELAFTWNGGQTTVELCDKTRAIMTDQGIPIFITTGAAITPTKMMKPKRPTRESDTVAIRLEALELRLEFFFKESLNQAFYSVCRAIRELQQMNLLLAHAEPTLVARKLLNDSNIMGRLQGTILEIWPCNPVESFTFLGMSKKCTEWLPINYTVQGQIAQGYMDPKSRIIYTNSAPAECDLVQETYLIDEHGKLYIFEARFGELRVANGPIASHTLHTATLVTYADYKRVIHKSIQMYTQEELRGQISLNDIFASVENHATIFKELGQVVEQPTNPQAHAILETASRYTPLGLLDILTSRIHWIWVQICCACVTGQILWKLIQCLVIKAMPTLRRQWRGKRPDEAIYSAISERTTTQPHTTPVKSPIVAIIEDGNEE